MGAWEVSQAPPEPDEAQTAGLASSAAISYGSMNSSEQFVPVSGLEILDRLGRQVQQTVEALLGRSTVRYEDINVAAVRSSLAGTSGSGSRCLRRAGARRCGSTCA